MGVCRSCCKELTYSNTSKYLKDVCISCNNKEKFKKDICNIIEKVKYIQETYELTYDDAIQTMKLYILEDGLCDISSNTDSIASAVSSLE